MGLHPRNSIDLDVTLRVRAVYVCAEYAKSAGSSIPSLHNQKPLAKAQLLFNLPADLCAGGRRQARDVMDKILLRKKEE